MKWEVTLMEYHGFVRCMEYILGCGLLLNTFVSDRDSAIAKHMREKLAGIKHYFDLWHLKKSKLLKSKKLHYCMKLCYKI